jgi:hypothetical protein
VVKEEIEIFSYLDAKEERKKALEKIRDIIFRLTIDYVEKMEVDHPAHIKEAREKANKIWEELCWRKQDYDVFMYDYKQDWDLNYNDYGLDNEGMGRGVDDSNK